MVVKTTVISFFFGRRIQSHSMSDVEVNLMTADQSYNPDDFRNNLIDLFHEAFAYLQSQIGQKARRDYFDEKGEPLTDEESSDFDEDDNRRLPVKNKNQNRPIAIDKIGLHLYTWESS
jgi:hypothetical protein